MAHRLVEISRLVLLFVDRNFEAICQFWGVLKSGNTSWDPLLSSE